MSEQTVRRRIVIWALIGNVVAIAFFQRVNVEDDPGPFASIALAGIAQVVIVAVWPIWLLAVLAHGKEAPKEKACAVLVGGW